MKRILLIFLPFLPYLASAQVAKDTVTVLTLEQIPAGTIRDTTNLTFVQDNAFNKARFDSLARYVTSKLIGDRGDITVSGSTGLTWELDAGVVDSMQLSAGAVVLPGAKVTGTLPVGKGGTGLSTMTAAGHIPYATSATALTTSTGLTFDGTDFATTGTATATKFIPTGGTGTGNGMYLPATNALAFSTNSLERMRIASTGNVGIGTISPQNILDLERNSATDQLVRLSNNIGAAKMRFVSADTSESQYQWTAQNGWVAAIAAKYNATANSQYMQFRVRGDSDANNTETGLNAATKMTILGSGNVGIGVVSPSSTLHLKAGTASANTSPLKFTSGTNLTTPEAGAMEFNGTNLFFTPSTTRHTVNHGLAGSATLNFASTNAQNSQDLTITVTGASDGDVVSLGVPNASVNANTCFTAWVSATNIVTVRFNNYSSGAVDPASGTFKVFVTK